MSDDQFTKLFTYMHEQFDLIHNEFGGKFQKIDANFDRVYGLLYKIIKDQEIQEQERYAINRQLNRHETWINTASPQLGIQYDPSRN